MESHPSYQPLSSLLTKYPKASAGLFQAYNDIVYAQQWRDVEVIDLEACSRGAIKGRKKDDTEAETRYVVPCSLSETLSFGWLQDAFKSLNLPSAIASTEELPASIHLAIASPDASIVYYKLSQGIVKPPV